MLILKSFAYSQVEENRCDTVSIIAPAYLVLEDTSIHIIKDSNAIICNKYIVLTDKNGYSLYSKLVGESRKHNLVNKLFQLLIASGTQDTMLINQAMMKAEDAYAPYKGKIIRNIKIQVLKPFGPTISDTNLPVISTWGRALNSSHINTNKRTIENKLMFKKFDKVDPLEFVENANELARLPYLQDATIIVSNSSTDSVDVLILAKDKFPWLPGINIYSVNRMTFSLKHVNILGFGHSLGAGVTMDTKSVPLLYLSDINYYNSNLYKQISSAVNYHVSNDDRLYQLLLNREIMPLSVRLGGGMELTQKEENIVIDPTDIENSRWYFKYRYYELWSSYLFYDRAKRKSQNLKDVYLLPGIGLYHKTYLYRPYVSIDSNSRFTNYTQLLGNFAVVKQNYYRTNYLLSFGKAEYIPYGFQAIVTGGYSWTEFMNKPYFGFGFALTQNIKDVGYIIGDFEIGAHFANGLEQGAIDTDLAFLSSIFVKNRYRFRFLINLNYTKGINRFTNDLLYLGESYGFIGMKDKAWYGQKRLFFEFKTISYTPWYLFGFRFACFAFGSAGLIGENDTNIFQNEILSSFGLGLYTKNDFLAFDSFQFRIAYFPVTPDGISNIGISFSSTGIIDRINFLNTKPTEVQYK
jgi:hypothetical protein